jgi:transcription initiation factor TFIIIB Brf1 subunit/transcription initiation factor TFIIB
LTQSLSWTVPKASDLPERVGREIEARMHELRPFVDEYEELLAIEETLPAEAARGVASRARAGARTGARATKPSVQHVNRASPPAAQRERAPRGAAAEAIVAALEHGSHTVSELAIVTAMSTQNIRNNLRRLLQAQTISQTKREGKTAYTLSSAE